MSNDLTDLAPPLDEADELIAALPGFVKRVPIPDAKELGFDWWSPDRTGDAGLDHITGGHYFHCTLRFCLRVDRPFLMMHATNSIYGRTFDHVECGFIEALAKSALVGRWPDFVPDQDIEAEVAGDPGAFAQFRDNEATAVLARDLCKIEGSNLPLCFFLAQCVLGKRGPWIGGATRMASMAAMNGSRH